MKIPLYFLLFWVFLSCVWQNAHSQFLNSDRNVDYLPPYDNTINIISLDIEKWMEAELVKNYEVKTIEMKTDVLGRIKKNLGIDVKGTEYKQVTVPKQKRLVVIFDIHVQELETEPMHIRYEYNPEAKDYNYYLNSKKISIKEYENLMEKHYEKFNSQNKGKRNLSISGIINSSDRSWIAWMTAEEISALIKNHKELAIYDYREPLYDAIDIAYVLSTIQLSTHAHQNNYKGAGIGIHLTEPGCRSASIPLLNINGYTSMCTGATHTHPSQTTNIAMFAAPLSHIFGLHTDNPFPSNPFSYSPPIEIGTHSYSYIPPSIYAHFYDEYDMAMDDYIYSNRVITFKSAGNRQGYHPIYDPNTCPPWSCDTTSYVSSPGKALNAITVGAIDDQNFYEYFSKWKNSDIGNEKPELVMHTNIDLGSYGGILGGTSASTPLAAGFTASLLDQHPFFKRQPALVKALLLTGETLPYQYDRDQDNFVAAKNITTYSSVAWGTRSAWWDGPSNSDFFDSNKEIRFTENNIQANKRYKIAIAWLVPGNYVNQHRVPPQNIDLYIVQNGNMIASSTSTKNPFELVDFVTNSNAPLTVVIKRNTNSGYGGVILGYHMRENY